MLDQQMLNVEIVSLYCDGDKPAVSYYYNFLCDISSNTCLYHSLTVSQLNIKISSIIQVSGLYHNQMIKPINSININVMLSYQKFFPDRIDKIDKNVLKWKLQIGISTCKSNFWQ